MTPINVKYGCPFCGRKSTIEWARENLRLRPTLICGNDDCYAVVEVSADTYEDALILWDIRPVHRRLIELSNKNENTSQE